MASPSATTNIANFHSGILFQNFYEQQQFKGFYEIHSTRLGKMHGTDIKEEDMKNPEGAPNGIVYNLPNDHYFFKVSKTKKCGWDWIIRLEPKFQDPEFLSEVAIELQLRIATSLMCSPQDIKIQFIDRMENQSDQNQNHIEEVSYDSTFSHLSNQSKNKRTNSVPVGFSVEKITGDGNCLFEAIRKGMLKLKKNQTNNTIPQSANDLRRLTMDSLLENLKEADELLPSQIIEYKDPIFMNINDKDQLIKKYIEEMKKPIIQQQLGKPTNIKPYQYGGIAEMNAVGTKYKIRIELYSVRHQSWQYHGDNERESDNDEDSTIYLRYTGDHYDLLVKEETIGRTKRKRNEEGNEEEKENVTNSIEDENKNNEAKEEKMDSSDTEDLQKKKRKLNNNSRIVSEQLKQKTNVSSDSSKSTEKFYFLRCFEKSPTGFARELLRSVDGTNLRPKKMEKVFHLEENENLHISSTDTKDIELMNELRDFKFNDKFRKKIRNDEEKIALIKEILGILRDQFQELAWK